MNMKPKLRPRWQRIPLCSAFCVLACWKICHLPTFFMPADIRAIVRSWSLPMMWVAIRSGFTEFYVDQASTFRMPTSFEPKTQVDPKYQLSSGQIQQFFERGIVGPFNAFTEDEILQMRPQLMDANTSISPTYGFETPRDRHLDMPSVAKMMTHPAIVERVAQILGPDFNCWRSQFFHKPAGTGQRIQWHQTSTFMVDDYLDPALDPTDPSDLFWLSIWMAVDDATVENGCMQFIPGTHHEIYTARVGGDEGFYNVKYQLNYEVDPEQVIDVEVKRGQFVIFTERCIHGSPPNNSDKDRCGFTALFSRPDVAVYRDKEYHRSHYNGGKFYLDKWGVVPVRGEDHLKLSRTREIDPSWFYDKSGPARRSAA